MVEKIYEEIGGDYEDAKSRLMNDSLIHKFVFKFLKDDSMTILRNAVKNGDIEESFRGAHTLTGVTANLSFVKLRSASSALTEQLRNLNAEADPELFEKVEIEYERVIRVIKKYMTRT